MIQKEYTITVQKPTPQGAFTLNVFHNDEPPQDIDVENCMSQCRDDSYGEYGKGLLVAFVDCVYKQEG